MVEGAFGHDDPSGRIVEDASVRLQRSESRQRLAQLGICWWIPRDVPTQPLDLGEIAREGDSLVACDVPENQLTLRQPPSQDDVSPPQSPDQQPESQRDSTPPNDPPQILAQPLAQPLAEKWQAFSLYSVRFREWLLIIDSHSLANPAAAQLWQSLQSALHTTPPRRFDWPLATGSRANPIGRVERLTGQSMRYALQGFILSGTDELKNSEKIALLGDWPLPEIPPKAQDMPHIRNMLETPSLKAVLWRHLSGSLGS